MKTPFSRRTGERSRPKARYTEGDVWPTSRAGPIPAEELSGERMQVEFRDLQMVPSLLANFLSTAICAPEGVVPPGLKAGSMKTRTDGPRFDLRMLMPQPQNA